MRKEGLKVIAKQFMADTGKWNSVNPRLPRAVLAFEETRDGGVLVKIGDGKTRWKDLKYFDIENIHLLKEYVHALVEQEAQLRAAYDVLLERGILALMPEGLQTFPVMLDELRARIDGEAGERELEDARLAGLLEDADGRMEEAAGSLEGLRRDFNAWIGRGGFLEACDFGTATPSQTDLTSYALRQIPSADGPLRIWNGTKVKNLHDGHVWILTNTRDTDPEIYEWSRQGHAELSPFDSDTGGYIKGAGPSDPPEYVRPVPGGQGMGRVDLEGIAVKIFETVSFRLEPNGDLFVTAGGPEPEPPEEPPEQEEPEEPEEEEEEQGEAAP